MSKVILAVSVAVLAAVSLILPVAVPAEPSPAAAFDPPPVAVCPIEEGSGRRTTVGIASGINGEGRLTAFAGGESAGSTEFTTGASGSAAIPVGEIAAVGLATGFAELPGVEVAAGSLIAGEESVALESCPATPAQQTLLAGGSTLSGLEHQVILMNPYAGEATVDLIVQSEAGLESTSQLAGISVPARSTHAIDMSELLPGREFLSITAEVVSGSVFTLGRLQSGPDHAVWNAVAPAADWFVPLPAAGLRGELIISSGIGAEVPYQLDLYGPDGVTEVFQEGVVAPRAAATVPLGGLELEAASAIRVVSAQPLAVFLRTMSDTGVALTSGSPVSAARWLLPGAGLSPGGQGSAVVVNTGLDEAAVVFTALRDQSAAQQYPVPAGAVLEIPAMEGGADAYTVKGEGSLVPLWVSTTAAGSAYSIGTPILDE